MRAVRKWLSMPENEPPVPAIPNARAVTRRRTPISLVWVIPILAAIVGAWVAVTRVLSEGPKMTIVLDSAEGLEAGKTAIRYKGVAIGTITRIRLSDDHQRVLAVAQMEPRTEDFLVEDSTFWVVRPRISGANVTGLGTLISGAYIGAEIGHSKIHKSDFVALETPPVVTGGTSGRVFILKTSDLGSLDTGTPLFYRRLQVGEVASYELDPDGKTFTVRIFVRAPYDKYVSPNTRFWQASGIDLTLGASGLSVQTQSLLSILIGGVAFETPADQPMLAEAAPRTAFTLFDTHAAALAPPSVGPQSYQLVFNESVRGLEVGAPVEFRGIPIGEVTGIRAQINLKNFEFSVPVTIQLDPQRLGVKVFNLKSGVDVEMLRRRLIDSLVAHGVRAQLRTGNLLTGAALVAFDFFPGSPPVTIDWSQYPPRLPTIPGQLEESEANVAEIINKFNRLPLKQIGDNLNKALADLDLTLQSTRATMLSARGTLDHANGLIGSNSTQVRQLDSTLQEVSGAARSIRVLTDYLDRHPEALIRGKPGEPK